MYRSFVSYLSVRLYYRCFFFFHAPAPTEIYTLSLHDALPIWAWRGFGSGRRRRSRRSRCSSGTGERRSERQRGDRKSTRLNSSHVRISYAVFCLKKKKSREERERNGMGGMGRRVYQESRQRRT